MVSQYSQKDYIKIVNAQLLLCLTVVNISGADSSWNDIRCSIFRSAFW